MKCTLLRLPAGAISDLLFLSIHSWLGPVAFLGYAAIAAGSGFYVAAYVPETKGKTLMEVQQLLAGADLFRGNEVTYQGDSRAAGTPDVELMQQRGPLARAHAAGPTNTTSVFTQFSRPWI
jgi:hypothetical protein